MLIRKDNNHIKNSFIITKEGNQQMTNNYMSSKNRHKQFIEELRSIVKKHNTYDKCDDIDLVNEIFDFDIDLNTPLNSLNDE